MIIYRIRYKDSGDEKQGYFLRAGKKYIKIQIQEGEAFEFKNTIEIKSMSLNQSTLKLEEENSLGDYIR